jgi:hypothetical protein
MGGEGSSTNFKRKILKVIKELSENGRHVEANELYKKYFGGTNGNS